MIKSYNKSFKIIVLLFILIGTFSKASPIDISRINEALILENSSIYFDKDNLTLKEIIDKKLFTTYHHTYINRGVSSETIWVTIILINNTTSNVDKILVLSSTLVEYAALYKDNLDTPLLKGVVHIDDEHTTLFPYFHIRLKPQTSKQYYLKIKSSINPIDFGLWIYDEKYYTSQDRAQQFINILLIGMVLALMIYSFILFFYTKDKSYLFYSFYLFALIYQQLTYLGLTQVYFPIGFVKMDIQITIFKITFLLITAALFSMHFLKTKEIPALNKWYKVFILISLIEMIILSIPKFQNLHIVILTATLFIIYNLFAGVLSFMHGNKQARLFILGFGIVFTSYILIISDALGLTSIMQDFQNILMISTALEALILSLAFADRYIILQKEKKKVDARILQESTNRTAIVKNEVIKKTKELNTALEIKEFLLKEVHHRVKNNLQIILSIIRLQNDEIEDSIVNEKFINLENRINAISKTYNMLLIKDNLEEIDMQEYINSLLADIEESVHPVNQEVKIITDINAKIPLRESVYIGLIVNELVINAYKYAFTKNHGIISITLHQNNHNYTLCIEDNGKGYTIDKKQQSLGLRLIHTLTYDQLGGEMETETNGHTKNIIRFTI